MVKTPGPQILGSQTPGAATADGDGRTSTEHWMSEIGSLLGELDHVTVAGSVAAPVISETVDNQLVQVRLGMAASLFAALQCKHAATASHTLRVSLTCSAWALKMGVDPKTRDTIEVAALLHDIGVIGVPDSILLKPGMLSSDEALAIVRSRHMSLEILRQCCTSLDLLDIVEHVSAWYDGSRDGYRFQGDDLPLGARMIAVAEAFDAMTADQVYRPAMSRERALAELFDCAGTQFDRDLVKQFSEFHDGDRSELHREVSRRWLHSIDPNLVHSYWRLNSVPTPRGTPGTDAMFQVKLLDNMHDAVAFINREGQIASWNRGAERLTGITASGVRQRRWHPELLKMTDEKGDAVDTPDCPVNSAIRSGVQSLRRLTIRGRTGQPVSVDTHAIPVMAEDGAVLGAILLFHDASSETSLEERCQMLYEKATKDPMTQVANRAEFDRVHEMFVNAHQQRKVPCSLIICDLDRFKLVNDTYGHQAGDEVIKSLANLLKSSCRSGDLVARYGGEEFVVLCADCDNATATQRAELVCHALARMAQPKMEGRSATVSCGVTEIQPGDTPETMLRRADRALLMAKSKGRNRVVQLGVGSATESKERESSSSFFRRKTPVPDTLLRRTMTTPVPIKIAIEKLRGFVADHQAKITTIDGNRVQLELSEPSIGRLRRLADRPITLRLDVRFQEERSRKEGDTTAVPDMVRTKIHVDVDAPKGRDRRRQELVNLAREVVVSFQSYLMASEERGSDDGKWNRAKRALAPWLTKKKS